MGLKKLVPKKFGTQEVQSKNILVHKNYYNKKIGSKQLVKIGPVTAEILLILTNVARACCLGKCHHDSWHLLKMVPQTYLYCLVKIWSVTAEIFLIWTNVPRTHMLPGQMSPCQLASIKDCPTKLPLIFTLFFYKKPTAWRVGSTFVNLNGVVGAYPY